MELFRKTVKVGNSAGVILPRKLLGCEVKISVINSPLNLKKEVLSLLDSSLEEIQGIYVINRKPIEVLAISNNVKKLVNEDRFKLSIVPLSIIKKDLAKIKEKLSKSEVILNKGLLAKLLGDKKL